MFPLQSCGEPKAPKHDSQTRTI